MPKFIEKLSFYFQKKCLTRKILIGSTIINNNQIISLKEEFLIY